jgi:dCMP deaminase
VHAEANAIAQAAKNGINVNQSEIYITASPCWTCFKLLANSGITKVVFGEFYKDERIFEAARLAKIELKHLKLENGD